MRNVFGYNLSNNTMNTQYDGVGFVEKTLDDELQNKLDSKNEQDAKAYQKKSLPANIVFTVSILFLFVGLLLFYLCIGSSNDINLSLMYQNKPAQFIAACILLAIGALMFITAQVILRKLKKIAMQAQRGKVPEDVEQECLASLGVPINAQRVDVFYFFYTDRAKKIKKYAKDYDFIAAEEWVYTENGNLYFADLNGVVKLPLSLCTSIEEIPRRCNVMGWNKKENCKSNTYKQYGVRTENGMIYRHKHYYALNINAVDGFQVLIPAYDVEAVASLVGLPVTQAESKSIFKRVK